jgi:hypothetical protein
VGPSYEEPNSKMPTSVKPILEGVWQKGERHFDTTTPPQSTTDSEPGGPAQTPYRAHRGFAKLPLRACLARDAK